MHVTQDEVAFLQDEIERKGTGFYIPLAKAIFTAKENMDALIEALGGAEGGMSNKDADAIPAGVGRAAGSAAETDIGKAIR